MDDQERQFLTHIRQLIEKGWTRAQFAMDWRHAEVHPLDEEAIAFCLLGAAIRIEETRRIAGELPIGKRRLEAMLSLEPGQIVPWNDDPNRTKEEVLTRIDKALA